MNYNQHTKTLLISSNFNDVLTYIPPDTVNIIFYENTEHHVFLILIKKLKKEFFQIHYNIYILDTILIKN